MSDKKPLIIIAGPTAVGKSDCAVKLACSLDAEIISADSMQVYRGMDIGTAKITADEMKGIKHYLIDVLDPTENFDVVRFKEMAVDALHEIYSHSKIPILVGGTGFYTQAVLYDIDFTDSATDAGLRSQLEADMDTLGEDAMYERLRQMDEASALAIPKENHKRIIRAIEYQMLTGSKISDHNADQRQKESPYDFHYFVLSGDREKMYERIDKRVDKMMAGGLVDEIKGLIDHGCKDDMTSMQGIGYKELIPYLRGECDLDTAVDTIKKDTRHFAKRQITWYKREPDAIWIDIDKQSPYEYIKAKLS